MSVPGPRTAAPAQHDHRYQYTSAYAAGRRSTSSPRSFQHTGARGSSTFEDDYMRSMHRPAYSPRAANQVNIGVAYGVRI